MEQNKTTWIVWKYNITGTSLAIQWLGLHTSTSGSSCLIAGQGIKVSQAAQHDQKTKQEVVKYYKCCNIILKSVACYLWMGKLSLLNLWVCADNITTWINDLLAVD